MNKNQALSDALFEAAVGFTRAHYDSARTARKEQCEHLEVAQVFYDQSTYEDVCKSCGKMMPLDLN